MNTALAGLSGGNSQIFFVGSRSGNMGPYIVKSEVWRRAMQVITDKPSGDCEVMIIWKNKTGKKEKSEFHWK